MSVYLQYNPGALEFGVGGGHSATASVYSICSDCSTVKMSNQDEWRHRAESLLAALFQARGDVEALQVSLVLPSLIGALGNENVDPDSVVERALRTAGISDETAQSGLTDPAKAIFRFLSEESSERLDDFRNLALSKAKAETFRSHQSYVFDGLPSSRDGNNGGQNESVSSLSMNHPNDARNNEAQSHSDGGSGSASNSRANSVGSGDDLARKARNIHDVPSRASDQESFDCSSLPNAIGENAKSENDNLLPDKPVINDAIEIQDEESEHGASSSHAGPAAFSAAAVAPDSASAPNEESLDNAESGPACKRLRHGDPEEKKSD